MDQRSPHSTSPIKLGTAFLERSPQLMNNVKLIPLDFTYHCSKMFNKYYCQTSQKKKDGTSCMLNGLILSLVDWKALFTLTSMEKNGCKHMLELLMPSWKSSKKKEASLKSSRQKRMESPTSKFIWTKNLLKLKENKPWENSFNTCRSINQLLISRMVLLTSINT